MLEVRYIYDVDKGPVNEYTIKNGKYQLSAINIGASITKMIVPNKFDKLENITLRYHDYKVYKSNPYYLGCLINTEKFIQNESCLLNMYFECTFEHNSLKFTYKEDNNYIYIKYCLLNNAFIIEYDTNLDINLSHVLFFNLSGNLKGNILTHNLNIDSKEIDLKEDIPYFKPYLKDFNRKTLNLFLKENGISLNVDLSYSDIYLSFGKYFNKKFLINKKNLADIYSGIGIVVKRSKRQHLVRYEFSEYR